MTIGESQPDSSLVLFDESRSRLLLKTARTMEEFRRVFGASLSVDSLAVIFVADWLGLDIVVPVNNKGFDARDRRTDARYEVKYRADSVQQVDLNNFEFDLLVLVNLGPNYYPSGMWQMTRAQAERAFVPREYRGIAKFQCSQAKFKAEADRLL